MSWLSTKLHKLNRINPNRTTKNYKIFKIILAILIVSSLIFRVSKNLAQTTINVMSIEEIAEAESQNRKARDQISSEGWNANSTLTTLLLAGDGLIGGSTFDETTGQVGYLFGGVASTTTNLIAKATEKPISGVQYLANIKDNLVGKPAYAQNGTGFQGLQPILPLWRAFRNIVYLLSAVFFVILGIMIMFRLKINPQTVLTIQNAIPKVVTSLILVSFSYAIAGLLIDLSYVFQNVVLATLFTATGTSFNSNLFPPKYLIGTTNSFAKLTDAGYWDVWRLVHLALPSWTINIGALLISTIIGLFTTNVAAGIISFAILKLIVAIIIVVFLSKFFFGILKTYISLLLKIILAPLEIGIGAIPGVKAGFSSWLNSFVAYLLVFPICLLFLVIANLIIDKTSGGVWGPNMVVNTSSAWIATPFIAASGGLIPVAIGFGTLMLLSKLPELIPQVIFAMKPSAWESAITEQGKGGIFAPIMKLGTVGKGAQNIAETAAYFKDWKDHIKPKADSPKIAVDSPRYKSGDTLSTEKPVGPNKSPDKLF